MIDLPASEYQLASVSPDVPNGSLGVPNLRNPVYHLHHFPSPSDLPILEFSMASARLTSDDSLGRLNARIHAHMHEICLKLE